MELNIQYPNTITPKKDEHRRTCNATIFQHVFLSILLFKQNELHIPMNKIKLAVHVLYVTCLVFYFIFNIYVL